MDNVFVIGDVHGNLDRLEALLKEAGLLVWCNDCDGGGDMHAIAGRSDLDCPECKGIGWKRVHREPDVTVVQLGDLGHFGDGGSPTGDLLCYKYVTENRWVDVVLWGNHDRAVVDPQHVFTDYQYHPEPLHFIERLHNEGRLQLAFTAYGFLITHAGLAAAFKQQRIDDELKTDVVKFVDWMNDQDELYLDTQGPHGSFQNEDKLDQQAIGIRDAISNRRGGYNSIGGLLWRDIEENLYDGWRQIFGHSADTKKHQVRYVTRNTHTRAIPPDGEWDGSYCIDVGGKPGRPSEKGVNPNTLAGIWLPSERIVKVNL